jgi:hypothetical protein
MKGNRVETFELLLAGGKRVQWNGKDGVDAARNYVAEHAGASVVAWRRPQYPLTVLGHTGRIWG